MVATNKIAKGEIDKWIFSRNASITMMPKR